MVLTGWLVLCGAGSAQVYEGETLVEVDLIAEVSAFEPGQPFLVALRMRQAEGWHTYWEFAGDSGLPTSIAWDLPEGFQAGPIQWPLPTRLIEPGDLRVNAYKGEVWLLTEIRPPPEWSGPARLRAKADWLVCEDICIPGAAELEIELSAAESPQPANSELFARWQARLPFAEGLPYPLAWEKNEGELVLNISGLPEGAVADFFPLPPGGVVPGHVRTEPAAEGIALHIPVQGGDGVGELPGVLVVEGGDGTRAGWRLGAGSVAMPAPAFAGNLWLFLFYGMLGGLILNLMPCVLPVISLKLFGFIRQAGDAPGRIFQMGAVFVAGMFAWFLGLAALIVILKSLGREVTWAFQFQSPVFIVVMSVIVFVFALNLFGVYEILLPGKAGSELSKMGDREGVSGVFFQGVFATILATPCTAPFLGTALAFAFAQPGPVIFLMFGSIAFGMGFPYLILAAKPGWMRFLPRPGGWMVQVKQFMGFLLLATLLWLLWILGHQGGVGAIVWTSAFLLVLAVICWMKGAFWDVAKTARTRWVTGVIALALLAGGAHLFLWGQLAAALQNPTQRGVAAAEGGIPWEDFSEERLRLEVGGERIVFVDFTAEWCITCKFNERTALETVAVRGWISENGVLPLKADWTNSNPEITRALASFGRVGVPFYVIYPAGASADPVVLPELLTEQIVLQGFREAKSRSSLPAGAEAGPPGGTEEPMVGINP